MSDKPTKIDGIEAALHRLCAALHDEGVYPKDVEIYLPREAWWRVMCRIEQKHPGMSVFDGRGQLPDRFSYMGIVYRVKS